MTVTQPPLGTQKRELKHRRQPLPNRVPNRRQSGPLSPYRRSRQSERCSQHSSTPQRRQYRAAATATPGARPTSWAPLRKDRLRSNSMVPGRATEARRFSQAQSSASITIPSYPGSTPAGRRARSQRPVHVVAHMRQHRPPRPHPRDPFQHPVEPGMRPVLRARWKQPTTQVSTPSSAAKAASSSVTTSVE